VQEDRPVRLTRRTVLLLPLAAAGCRAGKRRRLPASVRADRALLATAIAAERRLLAAYDTLTPPDSARPQHAAHLAALLARWPAPGAPPSPPSVGAPADLAATLRAGIGPLSAAALAAHDGAVAAVLASVAAAHAAAVEPLP
jgi:hypothetical protein